MNFDCTVEWFCCFLLFLAFIAFMVFGLIFQNISCGSDSKQIQQDHFGSQPVKPWYKQFVKKKPNYVWPRAAMFNRSNHGGREGIIPSAQALWSSVGLLGLPLSAQHGLHKETPLAAPLFWLLEAAVPAAALTQVPGLRPAQRTQIWPQDLLSAKTGWWPRGAFWCLAGVHTPGYRRPLSLTCEQSQRDASEIWK